MPGVCLWNASSFAPIMSKIRLWTGRSAVGSNSGAESRWWCLGSFDGKVAGQVPVKPRGAASVPKHTHLCSFHCDLASWAVSLAVFGSMSRYQLSACCCHLSPPSSLAPASASLLCRKVQAWKKGGTGLWILMQPRFCFRCTQPGLTKVMLPSAASWSFTCGWICNKLKVLLVFLAR